MEQQDIQISVPIIGVDIAPVAYAEQILDRGTNMTLDEVAKKSVAYGPYASPAAAHTALSADGLNTVGTTVGIIGSNNTVVEYWYQGGTAQANLVKKELGSNESDAVSFDGFIPLEPVTIIEGSASEPDAILYSRNVNRFVAKKGDKYYDNWEERGLYNNGNEPYTSKLYPYNGKSYTWDGTTFEAVGAEAVRYDAQTLTAQQKEQAAQNIGLDVVVKGDVQQSLSDAQKVNAQNNMMGKAYSSVAADHSGLGKVYLAKNNGMLTQSMMQATNTVYVIQYDFTLDEDITIPENCVLKFDGGSISGDGTGKDTITGNNTGIEAGLVKIFSNIVVSGSWNVDRIYSNWVDNNTNGLRNLIDLSSEYTNNVIYLEGGNYIGVVDTVKNSLIDLKSNTTLVINATIKLQTNGLDRYSIISVGGKKNVSIVGSGIIIGDADTHTIEGEGFCNGITVWESENVKIEGLVVENCFTDSIYVGGNSPSKNIRINDCQLKESRRQGISICNCIIFDVSNCAISDISGAEPERCIDIEPNANCVCKSGIICNNHFDSNRGLVCNGSATGAVVDGVFVKNNIFNTTEYSLDNVSSDNIYIDKNIINSGSISINSGTNIRISNNIINCQNFNIFATSSIICNKITANIFVTGPTEMEYNNINGNVSFGSSDIRLSENKIYNNTINGDLFVNSSNSEICNNLLLGKNDIRNAFSIRNNRFTYFTRIENDVVLTAINVKQVADNLFNTFKGSESISVQSLFTFISVTAFQYSTVISGNSFINNDAQLSQYFCVISPSSNTQRIFAYNNLCSEEGKTYGHPSIVFGTVVRYKNRGAENDAPTLPVTAIGNVYWDTDNNRPIYWNGTAWVDATGTEVS